MGCIPSAPSKEEVQEAKHKADRIAKRNTEVARIEADSALFAADTFAAAAKVDYTKGSEETQEQMREKVDEVRERYLRFAGMDSGYTSRYSIQHYLQNISNHYSDLEDSDAVAEKTRKAYEERRRELDGSLGALCEKLLRNPAVHARGFRESVFDLMRELKNPPDIPDVDQLNDEAEAYAASAAANKDKLIEEAWAKFCEKRDTARDRFFRAVSQNTAAMKPGFDAWVASHNAANEQGPLLGKVKEGEWCTIRPTATIVYNNGKESYRDVTDYIQQDFPDHTGASLEWSPFVKAEFAKLQDAYSSMVDTLLQKYNDPDSCYSTTGQIPAVGAQNVGPVTGRGSITHLTYSRVTGDEERFARGRFFNDHERLEYMRRMDSRPVEYNGMYWTQTHISLPAMNVAVEGLCWSGTDGHLLSYCFYDGKSSLQGLDIEQLKQEAMKDL